MEKNYEKENTNSNSAPTLEFSNTNDNSYNTLGTSDSKPLPSLSEISVEEERNEILRNYLPDLSNYQLMSFNIKDENDINQKFDIYPDVNYEENKKGYYIFYNNNLSQLETFYKAKLEQIKKENPVVLYHIKDYLKALDQKYDENSYYNPLRLISLLISYGYQPIVDKARAIAKNLIKIKEIKKNYGEELSKRICEIAVSDDEKGIFNEFIFYGIDYFVVNKKNENSLNEKEEIRKKIHNLGEQNYKEKESLYLKVETSIRELSNKYKDNLTYITELEKLLNFYYEEIGENTVEKEKKVFLCFILNRISYHLANAVEQLKENMSFEVLKKTNKLRRKINFLLLKYRYKFEQNKRPILDILIQNFKNLIDTTEIKSIYLERTELQKFINELGNALERKANNLKKEKNFDFLTINEIREIAVMRNGILNSNESIIQAIKERIDDLEEKINNNNNKMSEIALKAGIKLISNVAGINIEIPEGKNTDEKQKKGIGEINELLKENKNLKKQVDNYKNKLEKLNINKDYDVEFINILKLYSQLYRKQYLIRTDYAGLILSENKKFATIKDAKGIEKKEEMINLREYEIKEISKDN